MSQERFIRCPHCGLPHEAKTERCPMSGKPLDVAQRRPSKLPPTNNYSWEHSLQHSPLPKYSDLQPDELDTFVGKIVEGKYRIDKFIGHGGAGAVFRAENTRIGKSVALKVLYRGYAPGSEAERRFLREARVAGSIGHPNIVEVFDLGQLDDGKPFQVMELLEGESLADRLRNEGALREAQALEVADQVLSALEAAHARGIIHRDLKPENVYLVQRGGSLTAKLLDFGVSKDLTDQTLSITMTGVVVGTPFYLAPEQASGERDLDQRVDVWAMGVLLYETLTGVRPFNGSSYNELIAKILTTRPVPPSRFQPRLTPGVEAVILRALEFTREDRYPGAGAMRQALLGAVRAKNEPMAQFGEDDPDTGDGPTIRTDAEDETEITDSFLTNGIEIKKSDS